MKRYNSKIQAIADSCAREEDLFCFAAYLGRCRDFHVLHGDIYLFVPMHNDNIPRCEGFPSYITVMNGVADFLSDDYTLDALVNPISKYNNSIGRKLLKQLERKVELKDFLSEMEEERVSAIIDYYRCPWYGKSELYAYLAAAERLGMMLELFVDPENSRRYYYNGVDVLEQFIRLVPRP